MSVAQKQRRIHLAKSETLQAPMPDDLENLLVVERSRTIQFVAVMIWIIFAVSIAAWLKHEVALWFIGALFIYAIIVQVLYLQKRNLGAFTIAGIGAVAVFILLYQYLDFMGFSLMIESAALFTIVGTLFFRRRYLFYTNITSFVLFIIGALSVLNKGTSLGAVYQSFIVGFVFLVFVVAACWMFMSRSLRLLEKLTEAKSAMMVDALTQTYNRAYFDAVLGQIESVPQIESISILVMDLDHFKRVNDSFGHVVGDKVLSHFTKVIREHIRKKDSFIRVGGEEFALITWHEPDFNLEDYTTRLLQAVRNIPFEMDQDRKICLTTSIGGATYIAQEESIHSCFNRADQALYLAKDAGRNQAVLL